MRRSSVVALTGGILLALLARGAASDTPPGLHKPLSFSSTRVTLRQAVKSLGEAAGVPLTVSSAALAPRPVMLFLRGRTARQGMDDLARFVSTGKGTCTWVLRPDDGYVLREEPSNRTARQGYLERLRGQRTRQLNEDLRGTLRLGLLPDSALAAERARRPELVHAIPRLRPLLGLLAALRPDQRAALLSGKGVSVTVGDLDSSVQPYAATLVGGLRRERLTLPESIGGGWLEWRADRDLPRTPISIRLSGSPDRPGVCVWMVKLPGSRVGIDDLLHPPAPPKEERPVWLADLLEKQQRKEESARREFLDSVKRDPRLTHKISLTASISVADPAGTGRTTRRACDLSDVLAQVADQADLSVLGDYDPCWDDYYSHLDLHEPGIRSKQIFQNDVSDVPVWRAMELISRHFGVRWENGDGVLIVRSPRVPYALMDGIDVLDPPAPLSDWQKLLRSYRPGDRLPGVTYE